MKLPNVLKTMLVLLGVALFATAVHAQDPADDFLKAYFLLQDGDTAKKAGEKDKAIEKYNGSLEVLRRIQVENPDWNPNIINFRIKYCADNVTALGGTPSTGAAPKAAAKETPAAAAAPSVTAEPGEQASAKLSEMQNELNETRKQLETIKKEKDELEVKLKAVEESLKSVTAGKGDARLTELQKANDDLRRQLTEAEDKLRGVSGTGAVAELQQELAATKKQLDAALQENEKLRKDNESLRANLDEARGKLKALASSDETIKTMQRENALLRAIVERAYQEDAKRIDQKNQIKTDLTDQKARVLALEEQIAALSSPLTPLSTEERDLLKSPSLVIREADKGEPGSGEPDAAKKPLSGQNADLAKSARESYEKGDFDGAAQKYDSILKSEANNIFALSNLGVIRFRQEKLGEAETLLNKALDIDPTDAFSRSVLGIIYYKQGSYDEAISELTRSIALDGKAAEPHNYLGITYSQKGYQEAAEKELLKAVELSPNYGDAHFNLAVVYATQNPPAITLAKKHYKRALELNIPPDPELEKLFASASQ
jgi:regulator of replication initiation timing